MVVMTGTSTSKTAATLKLPVARKNATAIRSTIGSYAITCMVSRSAPTSAYGLRELYAAMMKRKLESVMMKMHRSRLPPVKKMPPATIANSSANVT